MGGNSRARRFVALVFVIFVVGVTFAAVPAHAITPCSDPDFCPVANEDNYTTPFNTALVVPKDQGVLVNDEGPGTAVVDLDSSDTESLAGATITWNKNGAFTYTPDPDPNNAFSGVDSFDYWILRPGTGDEDVNTVYVTVVPTVANDAYNVGMTGTTNIAAPGIFSNDHGIDTSAVDVDTTNAHGTVAVNDDGSFSYTPDDTFSGSASFTYTAFDLNFDNEYDATVNLTGVPRKPALSSPSSSVSLTTSLKPTWSVVTGDPYGIKGYDLQMRWSPSTGNLGSYSNLVTSKPVTSSSVTTSPGRTSCFRARAIDNKNYASKWSTERCTTVPLKASSLTYSSGWSASGRTDVYGGVVYSTKTKGAKVGATGKFAKNIVLVVTKCATCGTVQVRWNNVVKANLNLANATTVRKQIMRIALPSAGLGTLSVIVTSPTGKTVSIEGAGFSPL